MIDSTQSSSETLRQNARYIVQMAAPGGKRFLDECVVLEEIPTAKKIKWGETGIHWHDNFWIDANVKVIFVIPFHKITLRDRFKFWVVKHL